MKRPELSYFNWQKISTQVAMRNLWQHKSESEPARVTCQPQLHDVCTVCPSVPPPDVGGTFIDDVKTTALDEYCNGGIWGDAISEKQDPVSSCYQDTKRHLNRHLNYDHVIKCVCKITFSRLGRKWIRLPILFALYVQLNRKWIFPVSISHAGKVRAAPFGIGVVAHSSSIIKG